MEMHIEHLQLVFSTLCSHQLFPNIKKCVLRQNRIDYFGHVIDAQGVSTDPSKIQAMMEWPTPSNLRGLSEFMSLTSYYRKFMRTYSSLAWPLTQQLKKDVFQWNEEVNLAFQKLKRVMTSLPVLTLPDFSQEFVIKTYASGLGLGAVLMYQGGPVAFYNQKLSPAACTESVYDRELMAIVFAIQK